MRGGHQQTKANRRDAKSQLNDNNNNNNENNNNNRDNRNFNNNNRQQQTSGSQFDRRKQNQPTSPQKQQQPTNLTKKQPSQTQRQNQQQFRDRDSRDRSVQREYSVQRYRSVQRDRSVQSGGQYRASSIAGRDGAGYGGNLGAVEFTPGLPTRDLPPVETRADPSRKFTGRCRLFVGYLPLDTTEEQVETLFEPFGQTGEIFLGPKSSFALVTMDTRQNAEAARGALDFSTFDGKTLRVRFAAHPAAIRVKHLSPVVTNELLAYAFRYFGEIERAVVVVDDKGKSTGEGIVEYSKRQSASFAIKKCQQECFMLTASPMPVLVEPYDQLDEDEGLLEKYVDKNSNYFRKQRDVGPRFAEPGSFEHDFGLRWKELYRVEKQKLERLQQEIEKARKELQDQVEFYRLEHNERQLSSKVQQLENCRLKLQKMKVGHLSREQDHVVAVAPGDHNRVRSPEPDGGALQSAEPLRSGSSPLESATDGAKPAHSEQSAAQELTDQRPTGRQFPTQALRLWWQRQRNNL